MAEDVAQGTKNEDVVVDLKEVGQVKTEELLNYDGAIIDSPYFLILQ